jgi:hypothetical protein
MFYTYAVGYKGWGITKFGFTMNNVEKRVKQIGFNIHRDDFMCVAIEDYCESYAENLAFKKYGRNLWVSENKIFASPESNTGFVMRSGHTEVYNCPIEEAEDILRLASETRKIDNAYMQTKANERKIYSTLMDEYDDMEKISGSSWNPDRNPIKMIAA